MDDEPDPGGVDRERVNGVPTVTCSRCSREWDLEYELGELSSGNRAVEQFAIDHERHTGHFPDDVTPWIVECRRCPDGDRYLSESPARRWATTHARHTGHDVEIRPPQIESPAEIIGGEE
ncbi:MAG: hypothetical protein ABEJ58_05160 [Halodesulfurarchaeum sp.]